MRFGSRVVRRFRPSISAVISIVGAVRSLSMTKTRFCP
jgi:hypothetical protein